MKNYCLLLRCLIMQIKLDHFGHSLVDSKGLPRYWAAAWSLIIGGSLSISTLKQRQLNIDAFYRHAEECLSTGCLDDALADQNLTVLEELLESYFVTLRNVPEITTGTERRWRDAVEFVRTISERLTRTPDVSTRLVDIQLRLERLDRLYGQLRINKKINKNFERVRFFVCPGS